MNLLVHVAAIIFDTLAENLKKNLFERQPIEYRQGVDTEDQTQTFVQGKK